MSRKAEKASKKQEPGLGLRSLLGQRMVQVMLPVVASLVAAKDDLLSFMQQMGEEAAREVFEQEVTALAGPKGKHAAGRAMNRWGRSRAEFPLGGRRITLERPRVRRRLSGGGSEEVVLESVRQFQANDPLPERILSQILVGVSTRGYQASLERVPEQWRPHGTSKSAASRHLIERTRTRAKEFLSQRLDRLDLVAIMIDGVHIAEQAVVAAIGISQDGTKHALGLHAGSTENAVVCTGLLQDLLGRGLRIEQATLFVIDGGQGLRRALRDVLGDLAVVQRCQLHKRRNVLGYLPKRTHAYVERTMKDAYSSSSVDLARRRLRGLVDWLERDGHASAAASLREGLEETLTVVRLGLSDPLRAFFATTNAIENVMGTVRHVSRNVKRWRQGDMVWRWASLGLIRAAERFRRIKGHRDLPMLKNALSRIAKQSALDETIAAA